MKTNEDYWQVGDKVYSFRTQRKSQINKICLDYTYPVDTPECNYTLDGKFAIDDKFQTLFHIGAITFDEQDRPISINYNYVPEREPKVAITKLPHEFKEYDEDKCDCEIVLVKNHPNTVWEKRYFFEVLIRNNKYKVYNKVYKTLTYCDDDGADGYWKYCIPYLGNEHCENKSTGCESGKMSDDYVFPKKIFSDVKIGDILYRLYDGKYIKGKVTYLYEDRFSVTTEIPTNFGNSLDTEWNYNFDGTIVSCECKEQEQLLFKEIPEPELKPFDKVLVRQDKGYAWHIQLFSRIIQYSNGKKYLTLNGDYNCCIPFEGNEHLLGTINSPEE